MCGTPEYLSPEIIQSQGHGRSADWWALGVVVFELLVGVPPFHAASPVKIFENILSNDIAWPPEPAPKKPPNARAAAAAAADADAGSDADSDDAGLSGAARDFIRALLRPEVDDRLGTRLGAAEVKAHAFFAGVDWDGIQRACERENDDDDATDATRSAEMAVKDETEKLRDMESKLREASADKGELLDKLAGKNGPQKLRKLVDLVRKRAKEFSQPPIGPIGLYVKLKEEYWADAVEENIGQGLGSWLVGNMSDRDVLNKMIKHDCQMQGVTIVSMNVRRERYDLERNAAQRPPKSFKTMLDVLEFENDAVFNNVVDTSQVERVVLVESQSMAMDVVEKHANVAEAFTKDRKIVKRGNTRTDTAFRFNLRAKLSADKKERVTTLKAGIAECKKTLAARKKALAAARERRPPPEPRGGAPPPSRFAPPSRCSPRTRTAGSTYPSSSLPCTPGTPRYRRRSATC